MNRALALAALSLVFVFESAFAFGPKESGEKRSADAVREVYAHLATRQDSIAVQLRAAIDEVKALGFEGFVKVLPGVRLGKVEIMGAQLEKYLVPIEMKRLNGYQLETLSVLAVVEIDSTEAAPKVVSVLSLKKMDQFLSTPQN